MRVLLADHFPLGGPTAASHTRQLAEALIGQGHHVGALVADRERDDPQQFMELRVICRADDAQADLSFDLPTFSTAVVGVQTFESLTDRQLADYRSALRRALDRLVDQFNPDIIHVQHVWVLGQLALETGVPYVLTAWPDEFSAYAVDVRYRGLVEQAAENAGRIFVDSAQLAQRMLAALDGAVERARIVTLREGAHQSQAHRAQGAAPPLEQSELDEILAGYVAVLRERFG